MTRMVYCVIALLACLLFSITEAKAQERESLVRDKAESWLKERESALSTARDTRNEVPMDTDITSPFPGLNNYPQEATADITSASDIPEIEDETEATRLNRRGKQKNLRRLYRLRYPERFWPQVFLTFPCGKLLQPRFKISGHKAEIRFTWKF